ncbi:hypothetical protein ABPG75_010286 [Micractinium tetrahymenae]
MPQRTTIHHLPDDLLARCLAPLPQEDRFTSAALVSKLFHAAAARPERLSLRIDDVSGTAAALRRLRALQPWLLSHGASLQELELCCQLWGAEAASLLDGCLLAVTGGSNGSLLRLQLNSSIDGANFSLSGWASLRCPRQLTVRVPGKLQLFISLEGACQLRRLELAARGYEVGGAARLPPSLTKLVCRYSTMWAVPKSSGNLHDLQVGNLSCLRSLTLGGFGTGEDGPVGADGPLGGLSALHALQHLALVECRHASWLPAAAPHLTSLQVLEIEHAAWSQVADSVQASLQLLPQLRGLWLNAEFDGPEVFSAAAASLSSLQWLCLLSRDGELRLPGGPWQRSLCRLVLGPEVAAASVPFLQGLARLQHVTLPWPPSMTGAGQRHWRAFFDWAAHHPSLRRLDWLPEQEGFAYEFSMSPAAANAMVQLARMRPELQAECVEDTREQEPIFKVLAEWA